MLQMDIRCNNTSSNPCMNAFYRYVYAVCTNTDAEYGFEKMCKISNLKLSEGGVKYI